MGTVAAPNLLITLTDFSTGAADSGKSVEIVLHGDAYPGDAIALSEIGVTGKYKLETSSGVVAIAQGFYEVYADASFIALFTHGNSGIQDHMESTSDPHEVGAGQVDIVDSGALITAINVEDALQELMTAINTKAGSGSTLLTDNSTQSVSSSKAKVTNLNADKVDGKHVGFSLEQIPYLEEDADQNATLRLSTLPTNLTGKNADKLDGYHAGYSGGQIPILSSNVEAGRLHTSLLNIAQGYADGQIPKLLAAKGSTGLHTSLLNKEVGAGDLMIPRISIGIVAGFLSDTLLAVGMGSGNDEIPQITTDAAGEAGKIASSLLGTNPEAARTASGNITDTPAPDKYGGGSVWVEEGFAEESTAIHTLDDSMDWRQRIIHVSAYMRDGVAYLPGGANDTAIEGKDGGDTPEHYAAGMFFSSDGSAAGATSRLEFSFATEDDLLIFVDSTTGYLRAKKEAQAQESGWALLAKIDYSPVQNH